jgi:hypothetical protein
VNARNERFEVTDTYTGVSACQHYALSFSIEQKEDVAEGAAEFRIIVDDSFNDPKTHDVVVVIDKSAPSVSGPDNLIRYVDDPAHDCVIELNTTLPMETLIIEHDDMGLASAGLPVAVSRMVSETLVSGNENEAERIYTVSTRIFTIIGAVIAAVMFFGADILAALIKAKAELYIGLCGLSFNTGFSHYFLPRISRIASRSASICSRVPTVMRLKSFILSLVK